MLQSSVAFVGHSASPRLRALEAWSKKSSDRKWLAQALIARFPREGLPRTKAVLAQLERKGRRAVFKSVICSSRSSAVRLPLADKAGSLAKLGSGLRHAAVSLSSRSDRPLLVGHHSLNSPAKSRVALIKPGQSDEACYARLLRRRKQERASQCGADARRIVPAMQVEGKCRLPGGDVSRQPAG